MSALNNSIGRARLLCQTTLISVIFVNCWKDSKSNMLASNTYLFFQEVSSFVLSAFNVFELFINQFSHNFDSFIYDCFLNFWIFQHSQCGRWQRSFVSWCGGLGLRNKVFSSLGGKVCWWESKKDSISSVNTLSTADPKLSLKHGSFWSKCTLLKFNWYASVSLQLSKKIPLILRGSKTAVLLGKKAGISAQLNCKCM